jgi:hypothetical protein
VDAEKNFGGEVVEKMRIITARPVFKNFAAPDILFMPPPPKKKKI